MYRAAQFSRARVSSMLEQVAAVIQQMAADPDLPIDDISLVTVAAASLLPSPRAALPAVAYPPVTAVFARAVAAHPDRIAVDDRGALWTYDRLSRTAAAIARRVRAAGLEPGTRVGLIGSPGAGFLAAFLAIWSEGHVAVPLDSALTRARTLTMGRLAGVRSLVATDRVPDGWTGPADVIAVDLETLDLTAAPFDARPVGDAAYVCFTSGSRGTPKGVLGTHQGLSHFLSWQRTAFDVTPDDCIGQVTSPSFDVFFREGLLPLTSGASIVIPAATDAATSGGTLAWLRRAAITVLHALPAMAQSWLDAEPSVTALPSLRIVFFAGEPLTRTLVERWRARAPQCRIVNLYGPTETTLAKSFHEVADTPARDLVQIGRPLPGAQIFVLRGDQRCGIGEPGELVIRTPYRSLGYLSDAGGCRFVANPFTGAPTDVVYRTGDRGRYAPDGAIEIDGRFDDAVKIRGVRVDASEIAAVLTSHPAVRNAAVLVNRQDGISLVAYVAGDTPVPAAELRRHLIVCLPPAAVPGQFVWVRTLPCGSNGKVDRAALSELVVEPVAPRVLDAPETPTERTLGGLWSGVLGIPHVSCSDDFFDSGGHSLLAAQLVARINGVFGVEISLALVFDEPTLSGLAAAIDRAAAAPRTVAIPRADRQRYRGDEA